MNVCGLLRDDLVFTLEKDDGWRLQLLGCHAPALSRHLHLCCHGPSAPPCWTRGIKVEVWGKTDRTHCQAPQERRNALKAEDWYVLSVMTAETGEDADMILNKLHGGYASDCRDRFFDGCSASVSMMKRQFWWSSNPGLHKIFSGNCLQLLNGSGFSGRFFYHVVYSHLKITI